MITIIGRVMEAMSDELQQVKHAQDRESYIYHEGRLSMLKEITEWFKK